VSVTLASRIEVARVLRLARRRQADVFGARDDQRLLQRLQCHRRGAPPLPLADLQLGVAAPLVGRAGQDVGAQQVGRAKKCRHRRVHRAAVQLHRRPGLLDLAGLHQHDAVRQRHGLFLVVSDVDGGDAQAALQ
jgi:hypothetical protein